MKKSLILLAFSMLFSNAWAAGILYKTKKVEKYEKFQQEIVVLPTNFAQPFIIDQKDIELLAGKTIHHIDLVYTEFRSSPTFNQVALNNDRIRQLKKLLPQVNSDSPTWTWIEQTGAKTRDVANEYFHGFVIHYSEKLDHTALGEFFSELSLKETSFSVDAKTGGTFSYPSGTQIQIAPNSVVDKNGKPVNGSFDLTYREFRNPAEIALSGLPMTYKDANFSSVGMYELRGSKNGEELSLTKPAIVDFNATKVVDDAAFFKMDDKTGEWKKIEDIAFEGQEKPKEKAKAGAGQQFAPVNIVPIVDNEELDLRTEHTSIGNEQTRIILSEDSWAVYLKKNAAQPFIGVISTHPDEKKLIVEDKNLEKILQRIHGMEGGIDENRNNQANIGRFHKPLITDGTLLAEGADQGHTYPSLVKGLNSPTFGVYNCDQIYRIANLAQVSPQYINKSNGSVISDGHVACVLDLNYNGSFSFHPNNLMCNADGKNVILLFTENKRVFMLDAEAFEKLTISDSQKVSFNMTDVTAQLKSSADLKAMLNL